ncbi:SAM-dependent methyltransferase [uncultured Bacteroides sp.]|uniref:THUMP-like domain-containing protein n=1 Tax=uncultured Bacteroides sp. TaxID=162156 RepID=UPI00262A25E9|nr:SAM-dependent methyltransferase [uncultured Bacteroides sp.]
MTLTEETLQFIRLHRTDDVCSLALQAGRHPGVDMPAAVTQIAGWQAARPKIPTWAATDGILYPPHLSMEQCSSELTADYKAAIVAQAGGERHSLTDLTGGFGIDFSALAAKFERADYVERQEVLCELARHNFPLLGLKHATVHQADATEYLQGMEPVSWLFLDPARRDGHGGKTVAIADCEPDVARLEPLLLAKAGRVLLKLSPMLDLAQALHTLKHVTQAHVVAVGGECKELLLVLAADAALQPNEVPICCVNLPAAANVFTFSRQNEQNAPCIYANAPRAYLYEPHAALLKAGAFRSLTTRYKVEKLHPNSHLYTSDTQVEGFPGRTFHIDGWSGFGKREIKELLKGEKKANLTVRNFPTSVAELRKRLKLSEGGNIYLFATTLADGQKVLIRCSKP